MTFKITKRGGNGGQLHSQAKLFLETLPKDEKSFSEIVLEDLRSGPSSTQLFELQPAQVYCEEILITVRDNHDIRLRIYRKEENVIAAPLMFFHGGCWVFCSLGTHDSICRRLCYDSGMTVISVDYRLAPEYKFPTGIQDAYDAALYVYNNNEVLNVSASELILVGDSAGGNIASAVSLMASQSQAFKVRAQLLFYPICDVSSMSNESYKAFAKDHFLSAELMRFCAGHYAKSAEDYHHPLMSPLLSDKLEDMPKTLIQTAEFDILRDEAEQFATKLAEAGVDVECVRYQGMIHAFIALAGKIDLAKLAISDSVKFLKSFNI